jgi:hypothetical protein
MFTEVPKSLYFSSGMQPSLADVRDALRKQEFAHSTFDPHFVSHKFKKTFDTSKVLRLPDHDKFDPFYERETPVMDLLIKGHLRREELA